MNWNDLKIEMTGNESPEMVEIINNHNALVSKGKNLFTNGKVPTNKAAKK